MAFEVRERIVVAENCPSVKYRVSFTTGLQELCICENFQVMANVGLVSVKYAAKLHNTIGFHTQHAQNIQPKCVSGCFAKSQKVDGIGHQYIYIKIFRYSNCVLTESKRYQIQCCYTQGMSASISQMQLSYNAEEDRILFRVNSTDRKEFRFWITRRYSMLMLRILKEHSEVDPDIASQATPEAKQALQSFKQEKAVGQADFSKKFEEKASELPLGPEAVVAFKLNYGIKDGNLQLGVQPKEGKGITLMINQDLNATLTQLLLSAARKADWRIAAPEVGATVSPALKVIN